MILVLAGTSDGREIVKALVAAGHRVLACAATPYGARLLEGCGAAGISGRPLDRGEISRIIGESGVTALVDATHPYAEIVSQEAAAACRQNKIPYLRYERPASQPEDHPLVFYCKDYTGAAEKAAELGDVIFLSTGSKSLEIFIEAAFRKGRRVVARLLPGAAEIKRCLDLGLTPGDIVAMQGPFSHELNEAMLRHYGAGVLVTKDGGSRGGAREKVSAALKLGIPVVVVGRPESPPGSFGSVEHLVKSLKKSRRCDEDGREYWSELAVSDYTGPEPGEKQIQIQILTDPKAIERKSMAIIEESLPGLAGYPAGEKAIIKRVIHTTGDLSAGGLVRIHPQAVECGLKAIRAGRDIVTDIHMLKAGISSVRLKKFGITAHCLIQDPDVAEEAKRDGLTRSMVAMLKAVHKADGGIVAVGNAPTALFALCDQIRKGDAAPALVVGTPVGFVGAKESKEALMESGVPYVTLPGTRGGSAIAAAIVNALLYLA